MWRSIDPPTAFASLDLRLRTLPALGVAGAALAILLYYAVGSLIFASYLWGRYGVLRPAFLPPRLEWEPIREILRVGALSAIVSSTTNLRLPS